MLIGRMVSPSRPSTRSPLSSTCARITRYSMSSSTADDLLALLGELRGQRSLTFALSASAPGGAGVLVLGVDGLGHRPSRPAP